MWTSTHTKILYASIHVLWLISFIWTSKNFKWNNNTCCSKIETIWKLNFPDHFMSLLAPLTETKLNVSKPQNVKSAESFPELSKRIAIKQLISVSGYTKIQHGLYCPSVWKDINKQICKENLSKLGCCQITQEKMVDVFESNNDRKYRRLYRSFLKHRNNWAQYNNVCMTVVRRVRRWYRSFLKHRNNWAQYNNVCMTVVRRV